MSKKPADSEKPKKGTTKKKEMPKMQKPSGQSPNARVSTWGLAGKLRSGRGFSLQELREASISIAMAKKLGLYVDKRRSTKREENVSALKSWLSI